MSFFEDQSTTFWIIVAAAVLLGIFLIYWLVRKAASDARGDGGGRQTRVVRRSPRQRYRR